MPHEDFKVTSAQRKRKLLKYCWKSKKLRVKAMKLPNEIEEVHKLLTRAEDERYHVTSEEVVNAVALGGYRLRNSAISLSVLQEVCNLEPNLSVEKNASIFLSTAIKSTESNTITFNASKTIQLSIKIM